MRVVGAGLGRTGTHSLMLALEQLLGAPCYHMFVAAQHPDHTQVWRDASLGKMPDWVEFFHDYGAAVDWACLRLLAGNPRGISRRPRVAFRARCGRLVAKREYDDLYDI